MGDYLSNLVSRHLGQAKVVRPRPQALFEPPPATDREAAAPGQHARQPTGQPVPTTPQPIGTRPEGSLIQPASGPVEPVPSQLSRQGVPKRPGPGELTLPPVATGDRTDVMARRGRPTSEAIPRPGVPEQATVPGAPLSPIRHPLEPRPMPGVVATRPYITPRIEPATQPPSQSAAMPEPTPTTPQPTGTRPEGSLIQPASGPVEPVPSQLSRRGVPKQPGPGELTLPPVATGGRTDVMARRGRPTSEAIPQPGVPEQATVPGAPLSPTSPPLEPRPMQGAVAARPLITPRIEPATQPPGRSAATPEPAPTIRVTIGRVEVRAITPPAPPVARPKPARTGPTLSLDDYLQQRSRGQR